MANNHSQQSYAEFWIGLGAFLLSAAVSVALGLSNQGATPINLSEVYLNTLLGFSSIELLRLLLKFIAIEHRMANQDKKLLALISSNSIRTRISQTVYKAFFEDKIAHGAAARSMANLFRKISIEDDRLVLETDYLALQFYQEFWEVVLEAQRHLKAAGLPPLKVFATHSASVQVWERDEFARSRQQQADFCADKGELYRVLIRPTKSHEKDGDYERVIASMQARGAQTFFLDQKHTSLTNVHEYMLVSLEGEFFAISWNPNWQPTERGTLSACEVRVGADALKQEFWFRWWEVLRELEKPPQANLPAILSKRPLGPVLDRMRDLSHFSEAIREPPGRGAINEVP